MNDLALWRQARDGAIQTALDTWKLIEPFYDGSNDIQEKSEGPCTEADRAADRAIIAQLSQWFPPDQFGYLSEEGEDQEQRLARDHVWIIDPIDGTRDFIKHTGNFAIHIALVQRMADQKWHPVAAVVYLPVTGRMYSAVRGEGAWCQLVHPTAVAPDTQAPGERLQVSQRAELRLMRSAVSNSNRSGRLMRLINSLNLERHWHVGSLGVKLAQIAEGEADLYVNLALGKTKEWDTCAPHLILSEAGGILTDLGGRPLSYNNVDIYHRHGLLATNGSAHGLMLGQVRQFLSLESGAEGAVTPPRRQEASIDSSDGEQSS